MSRSHFAALNAIAFELHAALERYEQDIHELVGNWRGANDLEMFCDVGRQLDDIRTLCAALPEIQVQWVTVLISHTELMHDLWRVAQDRGCNVDLAVHLEDHEDCLKAMKARCRRILGGSMTGTRLQ